MLDDRRLSRLRWRCRRGLLENDLFIERFFDRHAAGMDEAEADAMESLMALSDNDLLDLLLRRREPDGELDRPAVRGLLGKLRQPAPAPGGA